MPFEGYNEEEHGSPDLDKLDLSKVCRRIVADKPRVTRFAIQWAGDASKSGSEAEDNDDNEAMDEEEDMGTMDVNCNTDPTMNTTRSMFTSPTREDSTSLSFSQNVVSPDVTGGQCLQDVVMSM